MATGVTVIRLFKHWTTGCCEICVTPVPLLQAFQNGVCHFCSLNTDQVKNETVPNAHSFFTSQICLIAGVTIKDHTIWLTVVSLPTPVSHPPLGGWCLHTLGHNST